MNWEKDDLEFTPLEGEAGEYTNPLVLVLREEWGALPPKGDLEPVAHPVKRICYTFSTQDNTCEAREDCVKVLQRMQKEHMNLGMSDIAYNFLVGRDGTVYEGRGWHAKSSKTLKYNPKLYEKRLDIGFIGDYSTSMIPPVDMLEGAINLGIFGMDNNYIREPYKVVEIRNWRERMRESRKRDREWKKKYKWPPSKYENFSDRNLGVDSKIENKKKTTKRKKHDWDNLETDIEKILPGCLKRYSSSKPPESDDECNFEKSLR